MRKEWNENINNNLLWQSENIFLLPLGRSCDSYCNITCLELTRDFTVFAQLKIIKSSKGSNPYISKELVHNLLSSFCIKIKFL